MFEELFGLKKRPFGSQATSSDVFIGPQTAGLITRARKVFAAPDGAMSVSGPVGSGKTTIVHRALSALGRQHTVIVIGRIKLGPDDVIEFLLRELGLKEMPAGTIQKLTVFRAILKKLAENDIRLFVIVEDAERLGNVALAELEALTATDSGVSEGANLVLMSEKSLKEAFKAPGMARLRQRTRLHYEVKPLSAPEVRGYLTNGLRQAGGDISKTIDDDAILAIHALSEGIPRVINGLVSSALDAVADNGATRLDLDTVKRVADDEYGLALDDLESRVASLAQTAPPAPAPAAEKPAEPEPIAAEPEPVAVEAQDDAPSETTIEDTQPTKILRDPPKEEEPELIQDTLPEVAALSSGEYPIPELIQDTLPDLEVLAPELAKSAFGDDAAGEPEPSPEPEIPELIQDTLETPALDAVEPTPEPEAEIPELVQETPTLAVEAEEPEIPELIQDTLETPTLDVAEAEPVPADDEIPILFDSSPGMQSPAVTPAEKPQAPAEPKDLPAAEAEPKEVPAWDRDPTMAELKPDLEALEHAMAVAQGLADDEEDQEVEVAEVEVEVEEVPEITLDDSIRRKIDVAEEMLKASTQSLEQIDGDGTGEGADLSSTVAEDLSKVPTRADEELERIASELAKAKTIEDVDDKMAETLFGEEFSMIAAELAANAPQSEPEVEAPIAPTAEELSLAETGTSLESPARATPAEPESASSMEKEFKEVYGEDALEVSMETSPSGMDVSASQRLATVRALNASTMPAGGKAGASSKPKGPEPEPIEDQINTSITQTLKALSVKEIEQVQTEEQEEEKSGFFSRFRKS